MNLNAKISVYNTKKDEKERERKKIRSTRSIAEKPDAMETKMKC